MVIDNIVVNFGDNTWNRLFDFHISYPCENTFDIWDWDTCDKIIYNNLLSEINHKPERKLIISHFLALDHIGHSTSSINHP